MYPYTSRDQFCIIIKPKNIGNYVHAQYFGCQPYMARDELTNIELLHKTCYSIGIANYSNYPSIAQIEIDGQSLGKFHCKARQVTTIERPIDVNKAFIFISCNSTIAANSAVNIHSPEGGIVKVTIYPQDPNYANQSNKWGFAGTSNETTGAKTTKSDIWGAATACDTSTTCKGMTVMTDGISSHNTSSRRGSTVLGDITDQIYKIGPYLETFGEHIYKIQLLVGDPEKNSEFFWDHDNTIFTPLKNSINIIR